MAFSYLGSTARVDVTPVTDTLDFTVTAGALLVAACWWQNEGGETVSVADDVNAGNWTAAGSASAGASTLSTYRVQFFYKIGSAASVTAVTATKSAGTADVAIAVSGYSSGSAITLDAAAVYNNHASAAPTTGASVTTVSGSLLVAMCLSGTGVTAAGNELPDSVAANLRESSDFGSNGLEDYLDAGAAGSKTLAFAVSSTPDNALGIIAFKDTVVAATQILRPDADTTTTGWTTTPLFSKVDEAVAGGDIITATAA